MEKKNNKCKPIFNVKKKVFLDALVDDYCGLNLYFSDYDKEEKFKIFFDSYISFRSSDESERFNSIDKLINTFLPQSFYEIITSEYISWIVEESQGIRSSDRIRHFMFVTNDDIIEVLSLEEPAFVKLEVESVINVQVE